MWLKLFPRLTVSEMGDDAEVSIGLYLFVKDLNRKVEVG